MAFQIIREIATYCTIRGGIIGSRRVRLPNTYETKACAQAIAERLSQIDHDRCGDDSYYAVDCATGARQLRPWIVSYATSMIF